MNLKYTQLHEVGVMMNSEKALQLYKAMLYQNNEFCLELLKDPAMDPNYIMLSKAEFVRSGAMTIDSSFIAGEDVDRSFFYLAIKYGLNEEVINEMLNKATDETLKNIFLQPASSITRAPERLLETIGKILEKRKINLNINEKCDKNGETCLHIAIRNGNLTLAALLLQCGMNLTQKNDAGQSAVDIAIEIYNFPFLEMILKRITPEELERVLDRAIQTSQLEFLERVVRDTPPGKTPFTLKQLEKLNEILIASPSMSFHQHVREHLASSIKHQPQDVQVAVQRTPRPPTRGVVSLFVFGACMALAGFIIGFIPFPIIPQLAGISFINIGIGFITLALGGIVTLIASVLYSNQEPTISTTKTEVQEQSTQEKPEEQVEETREREEKIQLAVETVISTQGVKKPPQPSYPRPVKQPISLNTGVNEQPIQEKPGEQVKKTREREERPQSVVETVNTPQAVKIPPEISSPRVVEQSISFDIDSLKEDLEAAKFPKKCIEEIITLASIPDTAEEVNMPNNTPEHIIPQHQDALVKKPAKDEAPHTPFSDSVIRHNSPIFNNTWQSAQEVENPEEGVNHSPFQK